MGCAIAGSSTPHSSTPKMFTKSFGCFDPGGKTAKTTAEISRTRDYSEYDEQEVYQDARFDTGGYTLKIPNGKFHVELKFCEIQHAAIGQRVFEVKVQGRTLAPRLDIFAEVGKNRAYGLRSPDVIVTNGLLKIEFVRVVGSPCIAAMSIGGDIDGATNSVQRVFYQHINCGGGGFRGYYSDYGM